MKSTFLLLLFFIGIHIPNSYAQETISLDQPFNIESENDLNLEAFRFINERVSAITYHSFFSGRYDSLNYFYSHPSDSLYQSSIRYRKDDDGIFQRYGTDTITYDDKNRVTSAFSYTWDSELHQFVYTYNSQISYDSNGNSSRISQRYNLDLQQWENTSREHIYFFEMSDVVKDELLFEWNKIKHQWDTTSITQYNKDGYIIDDIYYSYNPTEGEKTSYFRDEDNNIIKSILSTLDTINHVFVPYVFISSEHVNDTLIHQFFYSWEDDKWSLYRKSILNYNSNQHILSQTFLDSISVGNYELSTKYAYKYDANENIISILSLYWDTTSNEWKSSQETLQSFDNNHHLTNWKTAYWVEDSAKLVVKYNRNYTYSSYGNRTSYQKYEWDFDKEEWIPKYEAKWYFETYENGLATQENRIIPPLVYPNPTSKWLTFDFPIEIRNIQLTIFSSEGRILLRKHIRNHQIVDIQALPRGNYFFTVQNGHYSTNGKFIKN